MIEDVNEFKIGDKAKGFKFNGEKYPTIGYEDESMDGVVGKIGEVIAIGEESYTVRFENGDWWGYPNELAHLAVVEEKVVHFKGENKFSVGDKVKFKKSSLDSGMIDAKEEDVFTVQSVSLQRAWLKVKNTFGYYNFDHLEHVKEEAMNEEIKWEVGQEVWCLLRGKGVVVEINHNDPYPIEVQFNEDFEYYTRDGKFFDYHSNRTLFFSEPQITAELFPPKKPFVPSFKEGDTVVAKAKDGTNTVVFYVREEDEECVIANSGWKYPKRNNKFFKLTEEIKFN